MESVYVYDGLSYTRFGTPSGEARMNHLQALNNDLIVIQSTFNPIMATFGVGKSIYEGDYTGAVLGLTGSVSKPASYITNPISIYRDHQ